MESYEVKILSMARMRRVRNVCRNEFRRGIDCCSLTDRNWQRKRNNEVGVMDLGSHKRRIRRGTDRPRHRTTRAPRRTIRRIHTTRRGTSGVALSRRRRR